MAHPILMPKPGQMTEECVLVAWHKREGDKVEKGDVLFEIETDKSNMDVEAFEEGVLLKRVVQEGQTVPVNAVCAYIGEPGEAIPDGLPVAAAPIATSPAVAIAPAPAPAAASAKAVTAAATGVPPRSDDARLRISPRASRLAADSGLDPRTISGTGPEGRITERDVQAALQAASAALAGAAVAAAPVAPAAPVAGRPATPTTGPPPPRARPPGAAPRDADDGPASRRLEAAGAGDLRLGPR